MADQKDVKIAFPETILTVKIIVVGIALATGIAIGAGTTSVYYQYKLEAVPSPTPTMGPSPAFSLSPTVSVTNTPTPTPTKQCSRDVDCEFRCDESIIKKFGDTSHCPISSCEQGVCYWKAVP